MLKNVKSIEIIFENCEYIDVPVEVIGDLYIGDIREKIVRVATNSIAECETANEFAIEIFQNVNEICAFDGLFDSKDVINRLQKWNDIASLVVKYQDGSMQDLLIDYDEESAYLGAPNLNQKTYLSSLGVLYVVIAHGKEVSDYFDLVSINDNELIEKKRRIYGCCK